MKTKNLIIIFISFLAVALAGLAVINLTSDKNEPIESSAPASAAKTTNGLLKALNQAKAIHDSAERAAREVNQKIADDNRAETPLAISPEKIYLNFIINGKAIKTQAPAGSSVYDLMVKMQNENKIKFNGKTYPDLGFFVEEINGLKNNLIGENWLYYVNGRPAQVGISNYKLKQGDIIEWKYEDKNF
jgi:hypothetical protein